MKQNLILVVLSYFFFNSEIISQVSTTKSMAKDEDRYIEHLSHSRIHIDRAEKGFIQAQIKTERANLKAQKKLFKMTSKDEGASLSTLNLIKNEIIKSTETLEEFEREKDKRRDSIHAWQVYNEKYHLVGFQYIKNKLFYELQYGDEEKNSIKSLTSAGLNFGNNTGSIYSDLFSGKVGYIYVRLGSIIASSNSDDPEVARSEEAYQRLSMYGGNTALSAEWPLLWIRSKRNIFNATLSSHLRGIGDFAPLADTDNGFSAAVSYGLELFADISDPNKNIRIMSQLIFNKYHTTEDFANNLSFNKKDFWFNQFVLGVVVKERIKLSLVVPLNLNNLLDNSMESGMRGIFQTQVF